MYVYQHPTNYSIPDMYKWNKLNLFILNIRARLLTVLTLFIKDGSCIGHYLTCILTELSSKMCHLSLELVVVLRIKTINLFNYVLQTHEIPSPFEKLLLKLHFSSYAQETHKKKL